MRWLRSYHCTDAPDVGVATVSRKENPMTNNKKLDPKELAKVQGGKGRPAARASGGRAAGSKGANKGGRRR